MNGRKVLHSAILCALILFCIAMVSCSSLMENYSNEKVPRPNADLRASTSPEADTADSDSGNGNLSVAESSAKDGDGSSTENISRKVLFLKFINKSQYSDLDDQAGFEAIARGFSQANGFVLSQDSEVEHAVQYRESLPEYDLSSIYQVARNRGYSGVVTGSIEDLSITESGDEVGLLRSRSYGVGATIKVQLIDLQAEQELLSRTETSQVNEEYTQIFQSRSPANSESIRIVGAVDKAIDKMLPALTEALNRIAWTGRIAKIDLPRYYVSTSETNGVRIGQLLKVFGRGNPIFDEATKSLIGTAPGHFKGLLRVVDSLGKKGAIAIAQSGKGFVEQDRVELFTPPK